MGAIDDFVSELAEGKGSKLIGDKKYAIDLMNKVFDERYHKDEHYKARFQHRVNLQKGAEKQDKEEDASYAGWIGAENPSSGRYQGTSLVWFPGQEGSVLALVIGLDGFGVDADILSRPGHGRRLRALSRLSGGQIWVKPDLLDVNSDVPKSVSDRWPAIEGALRKYSRVIYAATAVKGPNDRERVEDLIDMFFTEHHIPLKDIAKDRWSKRNLDITGAVFPKISEDEVLEILRERRFVVLEGPPGTGKTRLAKSVAERVGSKTILQFHPARTYEDFVVGLFPKAVEGSLMFEVRAGDLLRANDEAAEREHVLVLDEINRTDLARVLGEAVFLFESGEADRSVELPYVPPGRERRFSLSKKLYVLGTRNTADRTIQRIDIAIRRRFAFIPMWPDLDPISEEGFDAAVRTFDDCIRTFIEYADEETMMLVPGHAYFLDPRPDLPREGREKRVLRRMKFELLPLLREYLEEKMCGGASEHVAGLADRVEAEVAAL